MKTPTKNLFFDSLAQNQPEDNPFDAYNANFDKIAGSVVNEEGFNLFITSVQTGTTIVQQTTLPVNTLPIGAEPIDSERIVLFLCRTTGGADEIGILYRNGLYERRIVDENLNFNRGHQIQAKAKLKNGEIIISWEDELNPTRVCNLDTLPFPSGLDANLGLIDSTEISLINLYPNHTQPNIQVISVSDTGGNIPSGSLRFFSFYESIDGSYTTYTLPKGPLTIITARQNIEWEKFDGCPADSSTTKAINLRIQNIDQNFRYLHLGVIMVIDNVTSIYEFSKLSITGTLIDTQFTNFETKSQIPTVEFLATPAPYKNGKTTFNVGGKLGIGNLEGFQDIGYQKYANNITVKSVTKTTGHESLSTLSSRNVTFLFDNVSFDYDEVYSVYIAFTLKNGGVTYGYHIPGRIASTITVDGNIVNENDTIRSIITSAGGSSDYLEADDIISPGLIRYFHTRDTGHHHSTGMGYWENQNERYPTESEDIDNNFETWEQDPLNPTQGRLKNKDLYQAKVRHHKMPSMRKNASDTTNFYNVSSKTSNMLGITLEDIFIPEDIAEQVTAFHIFIAKRTESNSTIVDRALLFHKQDGSGTGSEEFYMHPFRMFAESVEPVPTFLTAEFRYTFKTDVDLNATYGGAYTDGSNRRYTMFDTSVASISAISDNRYVRSISVEYDPVDLTEATGYQEERLKGFFDRTGVSLGDAPDYGYPTAAFPTSNPNKQLVTLRVYREDAYNSFASQSLYYTGNSLAISGAGVYSLSDIYSGDAYNSDLAIRLIQKAPSSVSANQGTPDDSYRQYYYYPLMSKINTDLRHATDDSNLGNDNSFYPRVPKDDGFYYLADDIEAEVNLILYDSSITRKSDIIPILPLPLSSTNITDFSRRIIISEDGTEESSYENWKRFLSGNYHDTPSTKGSITNIVDMGDEIIINTTRSLFRSVGSKTIKADEITTYIGSGDIFSVTPQEQIISEDGYAGCQSQWSCLKVPIGYIYVNQDKGKVFLYNGKLREISAIGFKQWFRENLPSKLKAQINAVTNTTTFNFDNPVYNVGVLTQYDTKYDRVILTKIDAEIKDTHLSKFKGNYDSATIYSVGDFVLGDDLDETGVTLGTMFYKYSIQPITGIDVWTLISTSDTEYFDDKSWTITFSMSSKGWRSLHAYKPRLMTKNDLDLISFSGDSLYKHNIEGKYGIYYDQDLKHEFFLEYVINTETDYTTGQPLAIDDQKLFDAFQWITEVIGITAFNYYDKTFTGLLVYNENQLSGYIALDSSNLELRNGTWRFNDFRDIVLNYANDTVYSQKGTPVFEVGATTSAKINTANINIDKHWSEQFYFKGKYVVLRLIYDNIDQYEINLHKYKAMVQKSYQ